LPHIQTIRLDNGVRVFLVERHDLPIVALSIVILRGTADAPPGVASLASAALYAGTITRRTGDIGNALRRLGVLENRVYTHDAMSIDINVLPSRLGSTLLLFGDLLQHSQVPPEVLETMRAQSLLRIRSQSTDPSVLIHHAMDAELFPPTHPYRELEGRDESAIRSATRSQVLSFFQTQVQPDTTAIVVAGDIDAAHLQSMVASAFGEWRGSATARTPIPEVAPSHSKARTIVVDRPGSTQATVLTAEVSVNRACPDLDSLMLLRAILGSRAGRLPLELRDEKGYSYSFGSAVAAERGAGRFVLSTSVAPAKVGDTIALILNETRRITSEPVSSDELAYAKAVVQSSLLMSFTSLGGTVHALSQLAMYDRPLDEYASLSARLAAINESTLLRVAKQYIRPSEMRVFVAADAAKVKDDLAKLGLPLVLIRPSPGAHDLTSVQIAGALDAP
jgi:predicted Zn-dependent peptidase